MNQKFFKTIKMGTILLIVLFLVLILFQKNTIGKSLPVGSLREGNYPSIYSGYPGQIQMPGGIPLPEISKEQSKNLERLLKMPTGKMNNDIYVKILAQISCLASIDEKIDEAKIAEIAKPYGVTGEEWIAYHLQILNNPIKWMELLDERTEEINKKFEELKKNNCQPKIKLPKGKKKAVIGGFFQDISPEDVQPTGKEEKKEVVSPAGEMTDDIWLEITARKKCIDRIALIFTKYEIETIFEPFGVTPAKYQAYSEDILKRMEDALKKFEDKLEDKDWIQTRRDKKWEEISEEIDKEYKDWVQGEEYKNWLQAKLDEKWKEFSKEYDKKLRNEERVNEDWCQAKLNEKKEEVLKEQKEKYKDWKQIRLDEKIGEAFKIEEILEEFDDQWTYEDWALLKLVRKLKPRIEELKKNNCVLEDGTPISEDYNVPIEEPKGWDRTKCKLFSCDNCYKVTEDSSWWAKYRCKNLCEGCPSSPPPPPPVVECLGFCSREKCPAYADKITGDCAPQKKCHRCWIFAKCCEEVPSVCCLTKPPEVCQGFCGLKNCPEGTVSAGEKNCPSGKEKYRCYVFFKCSRKVPGVCCVSRE